MDKIGSIQIQHITDREILLLTYQQLQTVNEEFRADKSSKDIVLHDMDMRIDKIERLLGTRDAVQTATEERAKRHFQRMGAVFTIINLIIATSAVLFSIFLKK